jgi:hypothetical protein
MQRRAEVFFRVYPDHAEYPDQWFMDEPRTADGEEIDARDFTEGVAYKGTAAAVLPVMQAGRQVAFSLSAFDMPVVSEAAANVVRRIGRAEDFELFPVKIRGAHGQHYILNVICRLECLDEARSEFTMWSQQDNDPQMMGNYKMISTIRIDPARAAGHHIFRIARWPLALLVSETLKEALEEIPDLGVVFESVV